MSLDVGRRFEGKMKLNEPERWKLGRILFSHIEVYLLRQTNSEMLSEFLS